MMGMLGMLTGGSKAKNREGNEEPVGDPNKDAMLEGLANQNAMTQQGLGQINGQITQGFPSSNDGAGLLPAIGPAGGNQEQGMPQMQQMQQPQQQPQNPMSGMVQPEEPEDGGFGMFSDFFKGTAEQPNGMTRLARGYETGGLVGALGMLGTDFAPKSNNSTMEQMTRKRGY